MKNPVTSRGLQSPGVLYNGRLRCEFFALRPSALEQVHPNRSIMRTLLSAAVVFASCLVATAQNATDPAETPAADAAEGVQLRWKFTPDTALNIMMVQDMKQEMKVAGQAMTSNMLNKTWSQWRTQEVQDDGSAKIVSEVTRVVMQMDNPVTGKILVDTEKEAAEEGQAAELDAMVRPMVGVEITNTMSPRGEVKDVQIPEEALAGLQALLEAR